MRLYHERHPIGLSVKIGKRSTCVFIVGRCSNIDRTDARGIPQRMRFGWSRAAYVDNVGTQKMRTLLPNGRPLGRKLVDIENQIRGALRSNGQLIGSSPAIKKGRCEAGLFVTIQSRSDDQNLPTSGPLK
jgi:hypothetical protein